MPRVFKTTSVQYPKENTKDEVDFLLTDKRQRFLQSDTIILDVHGQIWPNYPKEKVYYFSPIPSERNK